MGIQRWIVEVLSAVVGVGLALSQTLQSPGMIIAPTVPLGLYWLLRKKVRVQKIGVYLGCGILVGPSVLGVWLPSLTSMLFPYGLGPLQFMSNAATISMGFLAGCHIAADEEEIASMNGIVKKVRLISAFQIVSIIAGVAMISLIAQSFNPEIGGQHPWLMLVGLAVVLPVNALSVLTASLIEEGWEKTQFGKVAMLISVNTEVYLWPALTLASFLDTRAQIGILSNLVRIGEIGIYIGVMLLIRRHLMPRVRQCRHTIQVFTIVALILASAFTSDQLELHTLLGALLAGFVTASAAGPYAKWVTTPIRYGVMPYFLFGVGFLVPFNFGSPQVWAVALVMVVGTTAVQATIVAVMAHYRLDMPWREAIALGILSLTRGKTDVVVMKQLLDMGFISPIVYAGFVLTALWQLCTSPVLAHKIKGHTGT